MTLSSLSYLINKIAFYWRQLIIKREFKGADIENVVFGPELDKRFEVRCPQNLKIGNKTVVSGDLFINAWGG